MTSLRCCAQRQNIRYSQPTASGHNIHDDRWGHALS